MKTPGAMFGAVLNALFSKPATHAYPAVKFPTPEKFRGKIKFIPSRCIGCKMCMRDCPTSCITITKVGEKRFQAEFDLDRCIYCAQCVDSCPKDALEATPEFELAAFKRSQLKAVFHAEPPPSAPPGGEAAPPAGDAAPKAG